MMDKILTAIQNYVGIIPWVVLTMLTCILAVQVVRLIIKLVNWRKLINQPTVLLELTPPAFTDRLPNATGQLFTVLHGLGFSRSWVDRVLNREMVFALEIVSSRKQGIRFVMRVPEDKATVFEHTINAYLPEVKVKEVKDHLITSESKQTKVLAFRQTKHFAYPLQNVEQLEAHDPIAYLTNAMTKLNDDESMTFQLVLRPTKVAEAYSLSRKILSNEDIETHLHGKSSTGNIVVRFIGKVLSMFTDTITYMNHGTSGISSSIEQRELYEKHQISRGIKPARTITTFEHDLVTSIHDKLSQPLFSVDIRAVITASTAKELTKRVHSVQSALTSLSVAKYQAFEVIKARTKQSKRLRAYLLSKRLPSPVGRSNILAASEVASLYHFPNSISAKTENVVKSLSKTLPAPVSLKDGTKLDIILGENQHQGTRTPIGLTAAERERHVYMIGGTGNGKTTMLLYGIVQDINNGKGIAVIDPHGDLAETILHHIPKERIKDVIYVNPDDLTHPIGINLLELPPNLSGDELLREKDLVTESTVSVMRKMFSDDDSGGHRIEYILRNTIQTALTLEGSNLFTIFRLLNDTPYRKSVVKNLADKDLKIFWQNELGKAGDFQKVKMAAGITAKIGRFLFSASAKRMLEQEKSTIDFDEILSSGKILICNFSKGLLGEDTSTLFGTTVLAKLQMAALRRARQKQNTRKSFYLYVDEFQNFATMAFVQMLSEARKYKLFLTMAEQSTSQQDQQRLVDIILANVGTVVCFRSGSPADERLLLPLFSPFVDIGEIANLPAYNFYARIAAVQPQEPLSGVTKLLDSDGSEEIASSVVRSSRELYAKKEAKMKKIFTKADVKIKNTPNEKTVSTNRNSLLEVTKA